METRGELLVCFGQTGTEVHLEFLTHDTLTIMDRSSGEQLQNLERRLLIKWKLLGVSKLEWKFADDTDAQKVELGEAMRSLRSLSLKNSTDDKVICEISAIKLYDDVSVQQLYFKIHHNLYETYPVVPRIGIAQTEATAADLSESLRVTWYIANEESLLKHVERNVPLKKGKKAAPAISREQLFECLNTRMGLTSSARKYLERVGTKIGVGLTIDCPELGDRTGGGWRLLAKIERVDCPELEVSMISISAHCIEKPPPTVPWAETRLSKIPPKKTSCYRICTWNILAPIYASSEYAMGHMFKSCDPQYLDVDHRTPLIAKHITDIDADLYFFQECSYDVHRHVLSSLFTPRKLAGELFLKSSAAGEGLSVWWRNEKFKMVRSSALSFKDTYMSEEYADLRAECDSLWTNKFSTFVVLNLSNVTGLVWITDRATSTRLLLVNCHFYWHPKGDHIRTLQSFLVRNELLKLRDTYDRVIIAGDMNSTPGTGAMEVMANGSVPNDHHCWSSSREFHTQYFAGDKSGVSEEEAQSVGVKGPTLDIANAGKKELKLICAQAKGLEFTNHIGIFHGILDWIHVSSEFSIEWVLDGVSLNDVATFQEDLHMISEPEKLGLITPAFPSDHIALVCDIK